MIWLVCEVVGHYEPKSSMFPHPRCGILESAIRPARALSALRTLRLPPETSGVPTAMRLPGVPNPMQRPL